jgi:ribA/ribD-fused uncharacterized protein
MLRRTLHLPSLQELVVALETPPRHLDQELAMISSFIGQYRFLSNFWPAVVQLDGMKYPTVEHAYQAAKTLNPTHREMVRTAYSPGAAKRLGRTVSMRPDWDRIKLQTMRNLVEQKFQHSELREKLLATGDEELEEGNSWGDTFWGVSFGHGQNHLGRILMDIRSNS